MKGLKSIYPKNQFIPKPAKEILPFQRGDVRRTEGFELLGLRG